MTTTTHPNPFSTPDFSAVKARQQAAWSSGDYTAVGIALQIVSESLCEAVDLRAGSRVLDVATGHGNTALAAARRYADAVGIDYVPALLAAGRARSAADRLPVDFRAGDSEAIPYADGEFDYVLSTFGSMFSPDHVRTAREMARVCKPGGTIGLANWTPTSFVGRMFDTLRPYTSPPPGLTPPFAWGTESHLAQIFGASAAAIRAERKEFVFRFRSPAHCLDVFARTYGPVLKVLESLDAARREELSRALLAEMQRSNRSGDATLVLPSDYLEVVVRRA